TAQRSPRPSSRGRKRGFGKSPSSYGNCTPREFPLTPPSQPVPTGGRSRPRRSPPRLPRATGTWAPPARAPTENIRRDGDSRGAAWSAYSVAAAPRESRDEEADLLDVRLARRLRRDAGPGDRLVGAGRRGAPLRQRPGPGDRDVPLR